MNYEHDIKYELESVASHFGIDSETLLEILKDFFSDIEQQCDELEEQMKLLNYDTSASLLHTMKGSSAELQISNLNTMIKTMEQKVKSNQIVDVCSLKSLIISCKNEILQ